MKLVKRITLEQAELIYEQAYSEMCSESATGDDPVLESDVLCAVNKAFRLMVSNTNGGGYDDPYPGLARDDCIGSEDDSVLSSDLFMALNDLIDDIERLYTIDSGIVTDISTIVLLNPQGDMDVYLGLDDEELEHALVAFDRFKSIII